MATERKRSEDNEIAATSHRRARASRYSQQCSAQCTSSSNTVIWVRLLCSLAGRVSCPVFFVSKSLATLAGVTCGTSTTGSRSLHGNFRCSLRAPGVIVDGHREWLGASSSLAAPTRSQAAHGALLHHKFLRPGCTPEAARRLLRASHTTEGPGQSVAQPEQWRAVGGLYPLATSPSGRAQPLGEVVKGCNSLKRVAGSKPCTARKLSNQGARLKRKELPARSGR